MSNAHVAQMVERVSEEPEAGASKAPLGTTSGGVLHGGL